MSEYSGNSGNSGNSWQLVKKNQDRWRGGRYSQYRLNYNKKNRQKNHEKEVKKLAINDVNMFPILGNSNENKSDLQESKYNKDFVNAITNNIQHVQNVQNFEFNKDIKCGWTVINKYDKSIKTYNCKGILVDTNVLKTDINNLNKYNLHNLYVSMSKRWCNYYDEINYLIGDRSPYINYKNDILKIISEENDIMNKIYGEDYNSSSDDEKDYNDDMNFW